MSGETIIERGEAGEPARVITPDSGGPGVRTKDESRLPNQPLSLDTPTAIHKLRITRDEALTDFRWMCVGGRADEGLQGGVDRGFEVPTPHDFCEVVAQEAARRGLEDAIYDEMVPGQADAVRAAVIEAAKANLTSFTVNGERRPLLCPLAFDAGYMLARNNPEEAAILKQRQPNGAIFELNVAAQDEAAIAGAQLACYAQENASTLGGLVAGAARGLERGPDVSDVAPAGGRTQRVAGAMPR